MSIRKTNLECPLKSMRYQNAEGGFWRLAKGAETTRTIKIRKTNLECPLKSVRYQNAEGGSGDGCNLLEPMIQATSSMFPKEF
ncbi:MAG: hypothetical protein DMG24_14145 [Acidobacteria bacterium]|nr:MAG: hypothetical protein DMG24_14145 [Acidobacteriota bacterium]